MAGADAVEEPFALLVDGEVAGKRSKFDTKAGGQFDDSMLGERSACGGKVGGDVTRDAVFGIDEALAGQVEAVKVEGDARCEIVWILAVAE